MGASGPRIRSTIRRFSSPPSGQVHDGGKASCRGTSFFENTEPYLSPIHKLDPITAPTLVLHGANDTNVPVVEAEQVVDNLQRRNIPVRYILFPDEGHGFRDTENRVTATVEVVRWFGEWLGGGGQPSEEASAASGR